MLKTAVRNVLAHKLRLLTTGFAVALGVAFLAGTLVLTDTVGRAMDDMFAGAYEKTDAVVRSESTFEANGEQLRARVDDDLLGRLAQLEGVAEVQGDVSGFAQVVDRDGDPVGNPSAGPPTLGTSWSDSALNPWTLEEGRGPKAADEAVLNRGVAEDAGYGVGDRATVLVVGAPIEVTVTGIATFDGEDTYRGGTFVMLTTDAAQAAVGEVGKFDSFSLSAMPGTSQEALVEQIEPVLPPGMEALTGDEITEESQDAMAEAFSAFNQFMLVFALVALLVGGFIIFNTFFITVAQRTRQHALLRAVGASKRQVLGSILVEALAVGLVASVLGVAGGLAVAIGLEALLGAFGVGLPETEVALSLDTALISMMAGLAVTVAAALLPARRAGTVPPIAAMREAQTTSTTSASGWRSVVGLVVLVSGVSMLLLGLQSSAESAPGLVGIGAVVVFFGVALLGRIVSRPLSRVIGLPLPRLRGMTGTLARENAMRNPQRTAATASALMIGVGLVAFITIFAASTKSSFSKTIDLAYSGDLVITAPVGFDGGGGVSPQLTASLAQLPEVETAAGIRMGTAEIDGDVLQVLAAEDAAFDVFDIEPVAGSPDDLDATSIAVFEDVADEAGLSIGDPVPVVFSHTGRRDLTVAMIYGVNQPIGDWLLGVDAYEANYPAVNQVDVQVFVKRADGVTPETALAAVEREADAYPGASVLDQDQYKAEQMAFVDQMLGLVYALLALAVFIALLGIANTLALSILERTHELGLLRSVGMTRAQLRSTIRWESVLIAIQGTLLGVGVGVFFGWALVRAMADEGISTLTIPVPSLAVVVVIAAVAGVLAAVLPARRAARMDVLQAVIAE